MLCGGFSFCLASLSGQGTLQNLQLLLAVEQAKSDY